MRLSVRLSSAFTKPTKVGKKSKVTVGFVTSAVSLNLSATMVVMMIVHVFHCDSSPHTNHKCFNLALIVPPGDAEVAILSPVLPPGVSSKLGIKFIRQLVSSNKTEKKLHCSKIKFSFIIPIPQKWGSCVKCK